MRSRPGRVQVAGWKVNLTQQTAAVRWFVSPTLPPGVPHVYEVRVRWSEQGKDVEQTQQVIVRAGEQAQVAFPANAP